MSIYDKLVEIHGVHAHISTVYDKDKVTTSFRVFDAENRSFFYDVPDSAMIMHGEDHIANHIQRFKLTASVPDA